MLKNARNLLWDCNMFAYRNRRIFIFGARTIFQRRANVFPFAVDHDFSTRIRLISLRRSLAVLKNARNLLLDPGSYGLDSIYHPATAAAPLSILFGTHPPSRYILHLFFFPAILLLFLLVFFLSFFLFLSLPLSLPLPPFSSLINLRTSLKAR